MKLSLLTTALLAQSACALQSPLTRSQQPASAMEDLQLRNNNKINAISNPAGATKSSLFAASGQAAAGMRREDFVGNFAKAFGLTSYVAGATALGYTLKGNDEVANDVTMTAGLVEPSGDVLSTAEVRDLFSLWNNALMTGNPDTVAKRYAKEAVLLPTKSDIPRSDYEGIRDYFVHFLEKRPTGEILESYVSSQRNYATDVGIYEFTFQDGSKVRARYSYLYVKEDGEWKIKHHHSSGMPEAKR